MAKPWQPQGNCHPFEGAIIERMAPAQSGVYGLHTRRQQLFIGEAADLREALLLHSKEAAKLFRGRQPSFFAYEVCDATERAAHAQKLIAQFQPSIQLPQLLSLASLPPSAKVKQNNADAKESAFDASIHAPQWPVAPMARDEDTKRGFRYFSRNQLAILGISFVLTTTAAGLFGLVSGQKIAAKRRATIELASARRPVDAYMAATVADPGVASENATTDNGASEVEAATTTPPLQIVSATLRNTAVPTTPTKLSSDKGAEQPDQATANEPKLTTTASAKNEPSTATPWSVQISATQDQSAAQSLLAKLRNKGFDAYIVEAEINAAHWYRVRVGRFATNQEAEKIRRDLMASEKLASAFVTGR